MEIVSYHDDVAEMSATVRKKNKVYYFIVNLCWYDKRLKEMIDICGPKRMQEFNNMHMGRVNLMDTTTTTT